ncbi:MULTISPECIES: 1-deoxy-D-xylulose-5-phosphate reductoisomerase [unclassified Halomonas]|uniref:1-deoxy-D-xylulose-5-phosphate reductoisomerase n=1 Tax=unclassified Halomonas TaxID=2609666 RepID=UPI0004889995|nr:MULTISPECIES: 1-deoxy-D-xylulose-5-phosphate reductoisomerase [unclassified Halomonas]NAO95889.1 1-deoxy-D-xylulose-5-phosphate reductoisomerase [Halomonas sp. MG34]PKH61373.1 1-deoxy-D-xylulose-5-phosphate reductoisomerase [Halomonas sp. Choline-3u-9]QGQ69297.1 1-deoxy-D-xylulose-5-phosphate reductoisomerase [Halomonas sp. PA16-9]
MSQLANRQRVTVLGSTGSVGTSTLDVISRHPDRYCVHALTAHTSKEALLAQCLAHRPAVAVLDNEADAAWLRQELKRRAGQSTDVSAGPEALCDVARDASVDCVMAAIVGSAGLLPALAAAEAGKRVLLANKEALVMSGALFMEAVSRSGATLLPIDSEHNAIYQCLPAEHRGGLAKHGVRQLLLTASGGPFRTWSQAEINNVTPEQACAHPNWSMGRKISVDSATLMNKGLELIEACWLFDATPEQIQVVVHPQSVIHSMAAYQDGSVIAQLGNPDMRIPIAYGLAWPERIDSGVETLDLFQVARLDFEAPDETRFPCLGLAREAMRQGGMAPVVLNAANEVAVEAFLQRRIGFTAIGQLVADVLSRPYQGRVDSLDSVLATDQWARQQALELVTK